MEDIRTALVTGANRGIGLEFVRQFAKKGNRVFAGSRDLANAQDLNILKTVYPDHISLINLDVTNMQTLHEAQEVITEDVGRLDILINNAGVNAKSKDYLPQNTECEKLGFLTPNALSGMIHTNAIGPLMVAQQFLGLLSKSKSGKVLNMTSERGSTSLKASGGNYAYSASKAALNMYMKSFAFDALKVDVISVLVHPGWVATDMGGPAATLSPEQSVKNLVDLLERVTDKDIGHFLSPSGNSLPW